MKEYETRNNLISSTTTSPNETTADYQPSLQTKSNNEDTQFKNLPRCYHFDIKSYKGLKYHIEDKNLDSGEEGVQHKDKIEHENAGNQN